jgi:hypothetical protein
LVTVRNAGPGDFDAVLPLLREFRNPYVGDDRWRLLFSDPFRSGEASCGTVMHDGETAQGFLGALYSRRFLAGRERRLCNLTSWIVREPYRGRSLFMLLPLLKEPDTTVVDLTPSAEVAGLLLKAGFRDLESATSVLLPRFPSGLSCRVTFVGDGEENILTPEERRIRDDHRFPGCFAVLIESGVDRCFCVISRMVRRKKPFWLGVIHHLGHPDVFSRCSGRAVAKLCLRLRVTSLYVDERLLRGERIPGSFRLALKRPRLFRSADLEPGAVDGLYSEFPLLNI